MGRIALIGDYNPHVLAHQGIDRSLMIAGAASASLKWEWIPTTTLDATTSEPLQNCTGIWVTPASPYANESGVFAAIRWAREQGIPFLGTCGGFQHAVLEYARAILRLQQVSHAETDPAGAQHLIAPLRCSLVEQTGAVHLTSPRLRQIYGGSKSDEEYHCSFGINPEYAQLFEGGDLRVAARDSAGEIRAVELVPHRFFFATLFQPERRALGGMLHPLVQAFLEAAR